MIPTLKIDVLSKTYYLDNTVANKDKKFTYLSADATASDTTLTVQSIDGFAINKLLLIGEFGNEKSEIVKTHTATSPTGSTVTLLAGLTFDHPQDTKVYILDFNQVEISRATTAVGTKSVLTTIALQADQLETIYRDATNTTGYGFARFKDDINTLYTEYSDAIPYTGHADNAVFMIKKRALDSLNQKIDNLITNEYLNDSLWEARREYHQSVGKRPFRRLFDVDIGNVTTQMYRIAVPSDLEEPTTADNVYGVRIGKEQNMERYDKKEFDEDYRSIPHTTLASDYTVTDAEITLTDSRDFASSGTIEIQGDTIDYSANAVATGKLTISTDGASNHSEDDDIWQDVSDGLPTKFTVFPDADGTNYIYFNRPVNSDYADQNIYCDYYRTLVAYDSDSDVLDEPEFDCFVDYLKWKIKAKKSEGKLVAKNDTDFLEWQRKKNESLAKEKLGEEISFVPAIDHLP